MKMCGRFRRITRRIVSYFHDCNESNFYNDTLWIRRSHFLFGMLPLNLNKNGSLRYNNLKINLCLSIFIYVCLTTLCIKLTVTQRIAKLFTLLNDFDSFIINLMFISFAKVQFFYSIGGWFALKEMKRYYETWREYEILYEKKFKRPLVLKTLRTLSGRIFTISVVSGFSLIIGQLFTLPTYTIQECSAFIGPSLCSFVYIGIIFINSYAIQKASADLLQQLVKDLQLSPVTQDIIITHTKLWNYLSNVAQQFSSAFSYYNFIVIVGNIIDIIISAALSINLVFLEYSSIGGFIGLSSFYYSFHKICLGYGYLSILLSKMKTHKSFTNISKEELGLIVANVCLMYILVMITNCCHQITDKLTTPFIDELCMATTKYHNPKVNKNIDLYLLNIKNNPPVITLGGFTDINRSLITKVMSVSMTYYVVLLQFKISFNS